MKKILCVLLAVLMTTSIIAANDEKALWRGEYIQSGRGFSPELQQYTPTTIPDTHLVVEVYESGITVNGAYYKYVRTAGRTKVYQSDWGMTTRYYIRLDRSMYCETDGGYGFTVRYNCKPVEEE